MDKKAISPLVATVLLVAFAVALGAVFMSWARGMEMPSEIPSQCMVDTSIDLNPLQELQIQHITGELTQEEYLAKEKELLGT